MTGISCRAVFLDLSKAFDTLFTKLLAIIPRARIGSESIANEAEGPNGLLTQSPCMRVRGIIVLVKSIWLVKNIETKQFSLAKRNSAAIVLVFKAGAFCY